MVLGVWLFVSPWLMNAQGTAAWNACVLGAAVVAFAAVAVYMPRLWEEIVNLLLGLWLIVSPSLLLFASHYAAAVNAIAVGTLIIVVALWAIFEDAKFEKWQHEHHLP